MKPFRPVMFSIALAILLTVLAISAVYLLTPNSSNTNQQVSVQKSEAVKVKMPIDLTGEWQSVESKTGSKFLGHVKDNTVFIQIYANDGYTGLWYGTIDILQPGENVVVSKFIEDNQNHFALSTAKTKNFLYQNGSLIFDYTVMGTRTTVEMKRV